jgi:DNA-binding beta-propeller fold protein YncE
VFIAHGDRVTVVDGRDGTILGNIEGMPGGTHGVAISAATGRGYTDDGGTGTIVSFDLATLKVTGRVAGERDADGMVLEPATGLLFVVDADPGHLTVVDPKAGAVVATIDAGAALEFLVADGEGKVYVNGEANGEIVRVDARTRRVDARWPMPGCRSPHGLAIDRANRRLFSSCANGVLIVMDATSGAVVASLVIGQGTDAAAYDPRRHLVYSSNGRDGTITVIAQRDPQTYAVVATINTAVTGRTMGLDPETGRLYVAAADVDASVPAVAPGRRTPIVPGSLKLLFIDPLD